MRGNSLTATPYVPGWASLHSAAERAHAAATASTDGRHAEALHAIRSARARLDNAEASIEATAPAIADELDLLGETA